MNISYSVENKDQNHSSIKNTACTQRYIITQTRLEIYPIYIYIGTHPDPNVVYNYYLYAGEW